MAGVLTGNSFIRRPDLHCTGPEANHDEVMAYCTRAFDRARRAGVKIITFGSSGSRQLPDGFPEREGMDQFVALLKRMGPPAAEHGVTVVVEPLQQRECNFINRIGHVEEAVRRAGHPAIRGAADLYHMIVEGDTPADLAKAADIVSHVEIAETEGRRMPGASGQDFRPFFKVLKDAGFAGTIMVEGRWEPSELPTGFAEMRKQWREA
jgi:sugar phosphate isomerase/epimerase